MKKLLVLLLALSLSACVTIAPEPPVRIFNAKPLVPERWYEDLFHRMEKCLGKSRPYSAIQWFLVHPGTLIDVDVEGAGLWSWPANVFLDGRYVVAEFVLVHEMAHYILDEGDSAHDDPLFLMCTKV